ncbi:MAG: carbamoyltransferase C-terminal domain-containing protein [Nanoarchaeota archaeon]
MYILGLNIGHNATAALLKNEKIIRCVSEERFSRIKNHHGVPLKSIQWILHDAGISLKNVDLVVLDDQYKVINNPRFGRHFFEAYTQKSFAKKTFSSLGYRYPRAFSRYYAFKESMFSQEKQRKSIQKELASILRVPEKKIVVTDHHLMHAFAPLANLDRKKNWLIFTLDGEGSGTCASVNVYDGKSINVLSRTPKTASLGYLYGLATLHLGMKPLEHEFKVMGLAPYAKSHNVDEIYPKLKKLFSIDARGVFHSKFSMPFADHFFAREMKYVRFDTLAAAVQKITEELCCEWVKKMIENTGIAQVALSGGVFMNVKAVQKISELPEVQDLFVMPSCGDESNAIGACWYGYKTFSVKQKMSFEPLPLEDLYLGPEYDEKYMDKFIESNIVKEKYVVKRVKNINKEIAALLVKGEIVARCSGRSEWGARALGNRSILANPVHPDTIRILNETIKDRDFWMPFTPSMLDTFEKKYLQNPKKIFSPYMALTFDSMPLAQKQLPAAMHPYDFTIRPQIVTKKFNKEYYELIEHFSKLTGTGAILNTSFNLHGEPNVLTPEDALHTVEHSSLKYLILGNYLLEKK